MPKSTEPKLVFLDAMRGFAALMVFLGHAKFFLIPFTLSEAIASGAILTIIFSIIMQFFVFGHQAVILFVFLSGFWVAFSQIRKNLSKKDFVKRRLSKVYLPYIFALLFSLVVDLIGSYIFPDFYAKLILTIQSFFSTLFLFGALYTGFGSNIPLITVALIIICYLLYIIFQKHLLIGLLVGIIGTIAYVFSLEPILVVFVYWNIWLFGAIISQLYLQKKLFFNTFPRKVLARIFDLLTILFVLWVLYKNYFFSVWYADIFEDLIVGICLAYLVYRLLTTKIDLKLPSFFNKLSDYSYSLYLIHYPIIVVLYAAFTKDLVVFFAVIPIVWVITLLFNRAVIFSAMLYPAKKVVVPVGKAVSKK